MEIRYLNHNEIDKEKWDVCVDNSAFPLIYSNSFYLDIVAPGWCAFILEDYKAVFPLPIKSKMGIAYVAHPLFAQQLGMFSNESDPSVNEAFIAKMMRKFRRCHIRTNAHYAFEGKLWSERINLILKISSVAELEKAYNQNTKRNLKKFKESGLSIDTDLLTEDFIQFKKNNSRATLKNEEWQKMGNLINALIDRDAGFFRSVYKDEQLLSAVFYAKWKNRIYYLFSASNKHGMNVRASFGLVNAILNEFQEKALILDFEGSMDENIARFFKGFGAKEERYFEFKRSV